MKSIASKQKAVVGLSGGVDSTAAVLLLKEQGFEVTGVYLDVFGHGPDEKNTASEIARRLDIEFLTADVSEAFEKTVISGFCDSYMKGATPNPCVICNPEIKFKSLLEAADKLGAYHIATGHYAGVCREESDGRYYIRRLANNKKDQSYMLYRLNQRILERLILPLAGFETKMDVRAYVASKGIENADSKDSQEICFIPYGVHYSQYLEFRGLRSEKGPFTDTAGRIIGTHEGLYKYTVGQRKNLGMTFGKPMYVVKVDYENNRVVLGGSDELMAGSALSACNIFTGFDGDEMPEEYVGAEVLAKVRCAAALSEAVISRGEGKTIKTVFKKPERAVAPGQSIVFYIRDKVAGGGIII